MMMASIPPSSATSPAAASSRAVAEPREPVRRVPSWRAIVLTGDSVATKAVQRQRIAPRYTVTDDGRVTSTGHDASLSLHADRLFPPEPGVRAIARDLYETVRELPLICPHGHVDPRRLYTDEPFGDPASLLVTSDHYVTRLLHATGISLDELGVGGEPLSEDRARKIWRLLCGNWDVYRGTAVRYWLESQLVDLFGVTSRPSVRTADAIYDQIVACLLEDTFRPRALYARFGIEVLATTDDPCDDL